MNARSIVVAAWRESRGSRGRLAFFVACLALGVAAIVGVSSLVAAVQSGIRAQARELLGADMVVSSYRPLPDELEEQHALGIAHERTDVRELATMASSSKNGRSQLVEVKAIGGRFPFYGALKLEPASTLDALLTPETCVVAPELLSAGRLALGDELTIGSASYRVAGVVLDEPGRLGIAFTAGPRVFLTLDGLARAELERVGSRVRHKALYRYADESALYGGDVEAWSRLLAHVYLEDAEYLRFETYRDAQPTVRRAVDRVERYLGLVALLSLILGGIGVAMIVRAWIAERTGAVAVLRCLGYRPREVLVLYAGNVVMLAGIASALGGLLGSFVPLAIERWLGELLPTGVALTWQALPIARGVALGIAIALVFSLPPLLAIWRVAPARVLRQEAEPLPVPRAVRFGALAVLAAGLFGAAWVQSDDLEHAAVFTVGLAVLTGVLAACAFGLTRLAAKLPREHASPYLVHGIAALARPGAGVLGAAIALGFGVLVVLTMALAERELSQKLERAIPADAPTTFFVDVQPDQWPDVERVLTAHAASGVTRVPVVTARLSSVDGNEVESSRGRGEGRSRWALTREQRITWLQELPSSNRIVAGELWSDPSASEMSLEEDYAGDIGVVLGSKLVFDVQGVPVEFTVTSLRSVEWESFQINFFLVAEPGALEQAPHMLLGAARVDASEEDALQDELARTAPNVTLLRMRTILEKVRAVLDRLGLAVRVLGLFTVVVGLVILAGVASSTAVRRGREVALLKTLGVTRLGITGLFVTEFALLGMVAGLVGACGAFALAWAFLDRVLDLGPELPWWWLPLAALATALLAAASGLAATARALNTRPLESLRAF
ncbi:MAG: ABC transporter permease [Planctomycetes bacterium]|nr:ABC transporter permease [Planctomycetota bacterium]